MSSPRKILLLLLATAGCARSYVYRPTELVTASTDGFPAARYPVPPEQPHGTVYITSRGVNEVELEPGKPKANLLQLRMVVSNDGAGGPWTVDTREQILQLGAQGHSRPALVNSDRDGAPVLSIAPGEKRAIDLYYPLPENAQREKNLPRFDLLWRVHTHLRAVTQRTPFERFQVEPTPPAPLYARAGWAPYWWYDPFYPTLTFRGPVLLHDRYPALRHRARWSRPPSSINRASRPPPREPQ